MTEVPIGWTLVKDDKAKMGDKFYDFMNNKYNDIEEDDVGLDATSFTILIRKIEE